MEVLSQLAFVENFSPNDEVVINEEGYIQRLSAAFINDPHSENIEKIAAFLPHDVLTISMTISPETAILRAKGRKKGIPKAVKGSTETETLTNMHQFDQVLQKVTKVQLAKGCAVLVVDGESPNALDESVEWLRQRLTSTSKT